MVDGRIYDSNGNEVVKFAKKFNEREIGRLQNLGYVLSGAEVNFMVWWWAKDSGMEIKILLPMLHFCLVANKDVNVNM